ncbi:MAG: hypothetical protein PHW63_09340, partial [Alphaproteobacteria bacterium]|nr:hypothetical protein [Alphaproteobacteria bacterium]
MNFYNEYEPRTLLEDKDYQYRHRVEIRDGNGLYLGDVGDYSDLEWTISADAEDLEASQFSLRGTSRWAKTLMQANRRIILVHVLLYRGGDQVKTWTGRVDRSVRTLEGQQSTIKVELISEKGWLKYLQIWSAPFSAIWFQAPKIRIKAGPAIFIMKQFMIDNLLRLQSNANVFEKAELSLYHNNPSSWSTIQQHMYPLMVEPTRESEDTSPFSILTARMTTSSGLIGQVCKDHNLLPVVRFHVPGRDPEPKNAVMVRPGIIIDIVDKEKARARGTRPDIFQQISSVLTPFFRGMFGRVDVPPVMDTTNIEDLKDFYGRTEQDPWVIFRYSRKHWSKIETSAYAPTTTSSIAGGKSPEFLNKGIRLIVNTLIQSVLALIGIGFLGNLITGELDDILFAYQQANDPELRELLGEFAFFEDYSGQGTTA